MSNEKKLPWVIQVDETPEPWEDYSYIYCVVIGTKDRVEKYTDELKSKNPEWMVVARRPYGIKELTYL